MPWVFMVQGHFDLDHDLDFDHDVFNDNVIIWVIWIHFIIQPWDLRPLFFKLILKSTKDSYPVEQTFLNLETIPSI